MDEKSVIEIDLRKLLNKVYKHKFIFLASILFCMGLAYVYIKITPSMYKARATFLVNPVRKDRNFSDKIDGTLAPFELEKNIFNEIGVFKSYTLAKRTIEELDFGVYYFTKGLFKEVEHYGHFPIKVEAPESLTQIYGSPFKVVPLTDETFQLEYIDDEFKVTDPSTETTRKVKRPINYTGVFNYGEPIKHEYFNFTIHKSENVSPDEFKDEELFFKLLSVDGLANDYMKKLEVEQTDVQSSILSLEIVGTEIDKEVKYLKKLSDKYLENKVQKKNQIVADKEEFFRDQLNSISDSLTQAENSLEIFKRNANAVNLQQSASIALNNLQAYEMDRAQTELNLKYYQNLLEYVRSDSNQHKIIAPSVVGINDPLLSQNLLELERLNSERAAMNFYKGANSMDLQLLNKKIAATTESIQENLKSLIRSSELGLVEKDKYISSVESDINILPYNEKQLLKFERKSMLYGNLYNYLAQELAKTEIARADNIADAQLLDEPRQVSSKPVSPKKKMILAVGFLIGFILPFSFILFSKPENEVVTAQNLIQSYGEIPVIGSIVHFDHRPKFFLNEPTDWHVIESFRDVSACLQLMIKDPKENIIGFTSIVPGEGKTFCAMNLAVNLASSGKKTLLINADLRKPSMIEDNGEKELLGLSDYLRGKIKDVESIIMTHPDIPELSYLLTKVDDENPPRLLSNWRFGKMLDKLKEKYDYVIIDAPASGIVSDYLLISKHIDNHLFVVRRNYTKMAHLADIGNLKKKGNMKNAFFIFNDVKVGSSKYGYGYYDTYTRKPNGKSNITRFLPNSSN